MNFHNPLPHSPLYDTALSFFDSTAHRLWSTHLSFRNDPREDGGASEHVKLHPLQTASERYSTFTVKGRVAWAIAAIDIQRFVMVMGRCYYENEQRLLKVLLLGNFEYREVLLVSVVAI